jgi:pilus assembly protein CpaF
MDDLNPPDLMSNSDDETDSLAVPFDPDPPGTPPQRGHIEDWRSGRMRIQLKIADMIRKQVLAPDVPLSSTLDRTEKRESTAIRQIEKLIEGGRVKLPKGVKQADFIIATLDEVFGFGPLEPMLRDDGVSEIMVNGPYVVFLEKSGRLFESGHKFLDDDHLERIIQRIATPLGRLVNHDHPLLDARLPNGDRVNAVVRPLAIDGPSLTIRRFSTKKLTLQDLVGFGAMSPNMARFLRAAIVSRRNMVISGGTGSGKTTLINAMSQFIGKQDRVVTIEDAAELQLGQRNVVRLETKKATPDSPTNIDIRACLVNALRMRPERIIIGECRSGEALDMLQAMNTGHDGSLTTVHSNNPRDCVSRLETLVMMAGADLPLIVVRKQIASAVHFIVQASRLRDGSRKVTYITEVMRMEGEVVVLQDIFTFVEEDEDTKGRIIGRHKPTTNRPSCTKLFARLGFDFPPDFYSR